MGKVYILKKDCPNIGKEIGDYYNGEYADSIEVLLLKGVVEEQEEVDNSDDSIYKEWARDNKRESKF